MSKLYYLSPRAVTVEAAPATYRVTWRDWTVTLGLLVLNVLIALLVLLGACDAVAWVLA